MGTSDRGALTPVRLRRAFQRLSNGPPFSLGANGRLVYDPNTDTLSWVSPLTTKGDLYGWDVTDKRVPVGADGQILTADSTQALGLKWSAAPATGRRILSVNTADSTLVNNPGGGVPVDFSLTALIPAGTLNGVGKVAAVTSDWLIGGGALNTTRLRLHTQAGGVTVADTGAQTDVTTASVQWCMQHVLTCRTAGAAGILSVTTQAAQKNGATLITLPQLITAAIDLTANQTLVYEITFSTALATNTAIQTLLLLEALN